MEDGNAVEEASKATDMPILTDTHYLLFHVSVLRLTATLPADLDHCSWCGQREWNGMKRKEKKVQGGEIKWKVLFVGGGRTIQILFSEVKYPSVKILHYKLWTCLLKCTW